MKNVFLAYCHPGWVRAEFMQSVLAECTGGNKHVGGVFDARSGPLLTVTRNYVADAFLERSDMEWLWMVDTDMVFADGVLTGLLDAADPDERPMVGAHCMAESEGRTAPTVFAFGYDEHGITTPTINTANVPNQLIQCDATGCACLLVHRTVFDRISKYAPSWEHHWFEEHRIGDTQLGEDIAFCWRAKSAGIPLFVHTGINVGHMRSLMVGSLEVAT